MSSFGPLLTDAELDANIIELVDRARVRFEIAEGTSGRDACQALKLGLQFASLPQGVDGLLAEDEVRVNSTIEWRSRVEFTIFHEIIHHLLEDDGEIIDSLTNALANDDKAYRRAIEQCCQTGAAEFLAPQRRVREQIAEDGFSIDLIERLAGCFGTSIIASSIQLAVCAPVDCYVVVCSYGISPRFWPPTQTLYVEQAAMRYGMRYPLARFAPIPEDHLLNKTRERKRPLEESTYVPFPSGKTGMTCFGQAKPLFDRVIGILYLGHPPRKGQLGLGLN